MFENLKKAIETRRRENREREAQPEVMLARACEEIERAISAGDEKAARKIAAPIRKELAAVCVRRLGKCEGCLYNGSSSATGGTVCAVLADDIIPPIRAFFQARDSQAGYSASVAYCRSEVEELDRRYLRESRNRLEAAETNMREADERLAQARASARESLAKVGVDVELPD